MKKLLASAITVFLLLSACGATNDGNVEARAPVGFKMVSKDEFSDVYIYVFQHIETGCYYTYTDGYNSGDFEQMYYSGGSNLNGKPYCD